MNLRKYSSPSIAQKQAYRYLGKSAKLYPSTRKHKKYMIQKPHTRQWIHFGQLGYEDYTKHRNRTRRKNYLTRSAKIKGNWKDKYSPNHLARHILW